MQNKKCYVTIEGWMIELNLKPAELVLYAIIHGFSQDGKGYFFGSLDYLEEMTNMSRRAVWDTLQRLLDKKLIQKKVTQSVKIFDYEKKVSGMANIVLYWTTISRKKDVFLEITDDDLVTKNSMANSATESMANSATESMANSATESMANSATESMANSATNTTSNNKFHTTTLKAADKIFITKIKELFGNYCFDQNFCSAVMRLVSEFGLEVNDICGYLDYVYRLAEEKKPRNFTNFFYILAKSPNVIHEFMANRNTKTILKCPVCHEIVDNLEYCSNCNFDLSNIHNRKEIAIYQQIFGLSADQKNRLNTKLNMIRQNFFSKGFSDVDTHKLNSEIDGLYQEFGIVVEEN